MYYVVRIIYKPCPCTIYKNFFILDQLLIFIYNKGNTFFLNKNKAKKQNKTKQNKTKQNKTKQNKTKKRKTKQKKKYFIDFF